jgi:phosphoribosyl-ATP pyrophosphohydrolase
MAKSVKSKKKNGAVPLPKDVPAADAPLPKGVRRAEKAHLAPFEPGVAGADAQVLDRLWATIDSRRHAGDTRNSHSAKLIARGTPKVAQKFGEEAVELIIEAVAGNNPATVSECADVLYHMMVLLVDANIRPGAVWAELRRREGISGIAERASRPRPKALLALAQTTKLP